MAHYLLEFTDRGIYCRQADVYIDPWKPVKRALITHGHADHSRWGHDHYLCTRTARPVIRYRLGPINVETVEYGESRLINGVRFSFHPAGHIVGSAQIRVEYQGEVWVVSGDYKLENDGLSEPFESVPCHTFITECTFGLPTYQWQAQAEVLADINAWWAQNQSEGKISVITGHALGKAQRLLRGLNPEIGPIFTDGSIENTHTVLRNQGIKLPESTRLKQDTKLKQIKGGILIVPLYAVDAPLIKRFRPFSLGITSGWMASPGAHHTRNADRGFVLSDHADWEGLNRAVVATGAERVIATHGYTAQFSSWLSEQGYHTQAVHTEFTGEVFETS